MSICVIRSGGLGDCLLTLPVIHAAKRHHGDAPVIVLGNAMMGAVAGLAGWIDTWHDIDDPAFARLFSHGSLTDTLTRYFASVSHVYCFSATPEPDRLAARIRSAGADGCVLLDPRPPEGFQGHIITHLMSILPEEAYTESGSERIRSLIGTIPPSTAQHGLLIHPGSGSMAKNWPLERFCAVADTWDGDVTFVLGPAETERGFGQQLMERGYLTVNPASVGELAAHIACTAVYLGNDSGAAHLAGLLGVPSVVLFGLTDPVRWQPLGGKSVTLRAPDTAVAGISVDEVFKALTSLNTGQD